MSELKSMKPPILAGFGNPLLDICVNLRNTSNSFYSSFGVESDGQKEISASDLIRIIGYFSKKKSEFKCCAGGSAQNSLRVFQWLIKKPYYSVFFGGIGDDEQGQLLENEVKKAGVNTRYKKHENQSTGTCVAVINGTERSLIAHLGAANDYKVLDFNIPENINLFTNLYIAYIEGFFISHGFETALEVINLCKLNGVALAFNLSSPYLYDNHYEHILHVLKFTNILIGNVVEFYEFWKHYKGETKDFKEILLHVQSCVLFNEKNSTDRKPLRLSVLEKFNKIAVCTQSENTVLCIYGDKEYLEVNPKSIDRSAIVDTTGAGDAFVAGFFAGILGDKTLRDSVELGCRTARQIIQQVGCTLPSE